VQNSSITRNTATANGAGIFTDGSASAILSSARVLRNQGHWGAGIAMRDQSQMVVAGNCCVAEIVALVIGGGIALQPNVSFQGALTVAKNHKAPRGQNDAAEPVNMTLLSNASIEGRVSRASGGSFVRIKLHVVGAFGMPSEGFIVSAAVSGSAPIGLNFTDAAGIADMYVALRQPPGRCTVTLSLQEYVDMPVVDVTVVVRVA
jgi:hypothetical protein